MADQNQIDNAALQIAELVDKAKAEMIADLYNIKRSMTLGEFIEIISTIDIDGTLKRKLQKATSVYANAHRQVLESTIGFANIDSRILTGFASLNEQLFNDSIIRVISGNIRTQLVAGGEAGLSVAEIIAGVTDSSISNAQMQTLVNTTLNTYSRQVTNQMMDDAPDNTKYIYIGPIDEKTRPDCIEFAGAGKLTHEQIRSAGEKWKKSLVDGGGFNCRHKWEIASEEGESFFEGENINA